MSVIEIFPVKVYKVKLPNYRAVLKSLEPRLEYFRQNFAKRTTTSTGEDSKKTFNNIIHNFAFDNGAVEDYPELTEVVSFIEEHSKIFWKELQYHDRLTPQVKHLQLGMSYENGYLMDHVHVPWPMTASLYLKKPASSGDLVFTNPNDMVMMSQPIGDNYADHYYYNEIEEGDLVIFPGYIRHRFNQNKTTDERLCLAFNIGCKEIDARRPWGTI
jgi:uncharacterized protein (TIGR02466 family)